MATSSHLLQLQKYAQKHGTLPSESAAPLLFECDNLAAKEILRTLRQEGHLAASEDGQLKPGPRFCGEKTPLSLEKIPAGTPLAVTAQSHENLNIHTYLVPSPHTTIVVPISGDSMQNAGINDGDLGIIDVGGTPKAGDIVAAEVDGEFTLKYLETDAHGRAYLAPANPKYQNIFPTATLHIHGVLVGLARRY